MWRWGALFTDDAKPMPSSRPPSTPTLAASSTRRRLETNTNPTARLRIYYRSVSAQQALIGARSHLFIGTLRPTHHPSPRCHMANCRAARRRSGPPHSRAVQVVEAQTGRTPTSAHSGPRNVDHGPSLQRSGYTQTFNARMHLRWHSSRPRSTTTGAKAVGVRGSDRDVMVHCGVRSSSVHSCADQDSMRQRPK